MLRWTALPALLSVAAATSPALAQDPNGWGLPPPPPPPPPAEVVLPPGATALPPNVVTRPDGSISATRTPERGVDVHAPTPNGTVHAYGCSRVEVDPRRPVAVPPPPCPYAQPWYPPPAYYYPPGYAAAYVPKAKPKPKYAPDPGRRGALVGSSLVFGLGTLAAGTAYLASAANEGCYGGDFTTYCRREEPSKAALYAMGGIMTVTPSIPRFTMGDVGAGILYTALRGGSFAAGAFVDWKDKTYMVPVTFAFLVPLTLGIVDLATTPHREQMEGRKADEKPVEAKRPAVELAGLGPTATFDRTGKLAPALSANGRF